MTLFEHFTFFCKLFCASVTWNKQYLNIIYNQMLHSIALDISAGCTVCTMCTHHVWRIHCAHGPWAYSMRMRCFSEKSNKNIYVKVCNRLNSQLFVILFGFRSRKEHFSFIFQYWSLHQHQYEVDVYVSNFNSGIVHIFKWRTIDIARSHKCERMVLEKNWTENIQLDARTARSVWVSVFP